ncbi:hypothetical protein ACTFIV_008981 [Dictyostelium citrinum]
MFNSKKDTPKIYSHQNPIASKIAQKNPTAVPSNQHLQLSIRISSNSPISSPPISSSPIAVVPHHPDIESRASHSSIFRECAMKLLFWRAIETKRFRCPGFDILAWDIK